MKQCENTMTTSPVRNRINKNKKWKSYAVKKQLILSGLFKWNSVTINDHEEMEIVNMFFDLMICKEFNRTLDYVRWMTNVDYEEVKLFLMKKAAYSKAKPNKNSSKKR